MNEPTPLELLTNAYDLAKNVGLKFVYLGNLPTTDYDNTYCPKCGNLVIKRKILGIQNLHLDSNGACKFCRFPICII